MPNNATYDSDAPAALVKELDKLSPESLALLRTVKPAIRRALACGVTRGSIRRTINHRAGIKLTPDQLRRLLKEPDNEDESQGS